VACHRSECVRDRERGRAKAGEREGERVCVFVRVIHEICFCSLPENRGCVCAREGERERDNEREREGERKKCVSVCASVCVGACERACVCVCVCMCVCVSVR